MSLYWLAAGIVFLALTGVVMTIFVPEALAGYIFGVFIGALLAEVIRS